MEAAGFSEVSVTYQTKWHHTPEGSNHHDNEYLDSKGQGI
jgi:hypothetical protein